MSTKSTAASSGMPFLSILTLIFITLKLTGHIDWSLWWVLAPSWVPACIVVAFLFVCFIVVGGAKFYDIVSKKR